MNFSWHLSRLLVCTAMLAATTTWASADDEFEPTADPTNESPVVSVSEQLEAVESSYAMGESAGVGAESCGTGCGAGLFGFGGGINKAALGAHKVVFYDNDFSYLCDPCSDRYLGDRLKRMSFGDHVVVDVGGQYRTRYHFEDNMRGLGLGTIANDDDFLLHRTRVYLNAEIGQRVRFYGEMLDAVSNYERFTPRPIEENRAEIQNMFLDLKVFDDCCHSVTARVGRQELLYGGQHLVSVLDWANTRRTFEGGKLMWSGQNWDVDGFWTRPLTRQNPDYLYALDSPNPNQEFYGVYSKYKGLGADTLNLFWLGYDDRALGFLYDTIGGRYETTRGNWLFSAWGGYQFGRNADGSDHSAGAFTGGVGRKFPCAFWSPTLWAYYDWASGDANGNGFDHLFPLAHKYLGLIDFFGRRNLRDANLLFTMSPHQRVKLLLWYHYFQRAQNDDPAYKLNMTPYAIGGDSYELGNELDLLTSITLTERMNLIFGYSHYESGAYFTDAGRAPTADFFYTQFHVNF